MQHIFKYMGDKTVETSYIMYLSLPAARIAIPTHCFPPGEGMGLLHCLKLVFLQPWDETHRLKFQGPHFPHFPSIMIMLRCNFRFSLMVLNTLLIAVIVIEGLECHSLPIQTWALHTLVDFFGPMHSFPPPWTATLMVRVRHCWPPPHNFEQELQSSQSFHTQSTRMR